MKNKITAIIIIIIGLISSVVLHETLHVLLHLGHIKAINIFPPNGNIAQVVADTPIGYNVQLEEAFAYSITVIVVIITIVIANIVWYKK